MARSHPLSKPLRQRFLQFLNSDINFRKKKNLQSQSAAHHGPRERGSNPSPLCDLEIFWFMAHWLVLLLCVVFFVLGISLPLSLLSWFSYYIYVFTFVHMDIEAIYLHTHSLLYSYTFSDAFRDPKTSVFFAPMS